MKIRTILEASMKPSTLQKFIKSPAAKGIRAGFEAELCFVDTNNIRDTLDLEDEELDFEDNMFFDKLEDVESWFSQYFTGSNLNKIMSYVTDTCKEVHSNNILNSKPSERWELLYEYFSKQNLDEEIKLHLLHSNLDLDIDIDELEAARQAVIEKEVDFYNSNDANFSKISHDVIRETTIDYGTILDTHDDLDAISICQHVGLRYPISPPSAEYSSDFAKILATSLHNQLNVFVNIGDDYKSIARNDIDWIIEPDNSISRSNDSDFVAEIISPPMQLDVFFKKLKSFFAWAKTVDAYANATTGFHVGVSLPTSASPIDYIKLAMFLGDEHLLKRFGREANMYCVDAATGIYNHLSETDINDDKTNISIAADKLNSILLLLKHGCYSIASMNMQTRNSDKYMSINVREDYIEFRILGGKDYLDKLDEIETVVMRYAYAMVIASNESMYKDEYGKKLYKFLSMDKSMKGTSMNIVAEYIAGNISSEDLKKLYSSKKSGSKIPGSNLQSNK